MSAKGLNKIMIIGNVGRAPEVRFVASGHCVADFSIAINEKRREKEYATWFNVVAWGKLAETVGEYLNKGDRIYVEGSIKFKHYENPRFVGAKFWSAEITAQNIIFLDDKERPVPDKEAQPEDDPLKLLAQERTEGELRADDDDIPF